MNWSDWSEGQTPPEDVREIDQLLQRVRFQPRDSLEPELLGRAGRGELPQLTARRSSFGRVVAGVLAMGAVVVLGLWGVAGDNPVQIDRCCYDLDGGGVADDGALIIAERDGRVHRLSVYEDRDGSGTLSSADTVRLDRTDAPVLQELPPGLTRIRHCCQDFDGGGPPDDELLVVATPPDQVHTAAIYELR